MTIDKVEIEEQHSVQTPLVKLVAILGVPPVLDALTTKVNEVQESTSDSVEEVLSSEELTDLTSIGTKVRSPTNYNDKGVESVPGSSTHHMWTQRVTQHYHHSTQTLTLITQCHQHFQRYIPVYLA